MKNLLFILTLFVFFSCNNQSESTEGSGDAPTTVESAEMTAPEYNLEKTSLTWTAFKTPEKVGVSGTFDDITLNGNQFSIDATSVNSGDGIRDPKLVQFFFEKMSNTTISGSYGAPEGSKIPITISMNGVEKSFDFDYEVNDTATLVSGTIDIVSDFSGNAALEAINEACNELHAGKTWTDVDINIVSMK